MKVEIANVNSVSELTEKLESKYRTIKNLCRYCYTINFTSNLTSANNKIQIR
jgi:hypothetical protein